MSWLSRLFIMYVVGVATFFLFSCFSWAIEPSTFAYSFILALAFPFLLILHLLNTIALAMFFRRRRYVIVLLLLTIAGYKNILSTFGLNPAAEFTKVKSPNHLRILTWNVGYWHSLTRYNTGDADSREQMLQMLQRYNADILCFQEHAQAKRPNKIDINARLRKMGYNHILIPPSKTKPQHQNYDGTIIYSKVPFSGTYITQTGLGFRPEPLLGIDVMLNSKPIRIYTVHMLSYALFSGATLESSDKVIAKRTYKSKGAIVRKLRDINLLHQRQASIIQQQLHASPYPVILCGDLNATPTFNSVHRLKGDLRDAYIATNLGVGRTFKSLQPFLRIDYCFVDKKLRIVQNTVETEPISDHYPVVTDVSW